MKKIFLLTTLMLIPFIRTSSECNGFLIKELHYYIECSSKILDEDLEEIETNEQDILHIRRGGYGELNKLTISSEETGFEYEFKLDKFCDYGQEELENDIIWRALNGNIILAYDEFISFPRILVTTKTPRKNYMFWIKKVYQVIGGKNKKNVPVDINEFKDDFINWLKNEVDDEDNEE